MKRTSKWSSIQRSILGPVSLMLSASCSSGTGVTSSPAALLGEPPPHIVTDSSGSAPAQTLISDITSVDVARLPQVSVHPGYGPRGAVGPQSSIVCSSNSVHINPGSNVQSIVNAHGAGTSYCLGAGTFARQQITPKSGDVYVGVKGAVLDGQNSSTHAFISAAKGVTVKNLVIKNYSTAYQDAPIDTGYYGGSNWSIYNNEISSNRAAGLDTGSGDHVIANYIHDNGREGYMASGAGEVWTDNEISYNNPNNTAPNGDFGGGKAWMTTNLTIEYNSVHDNHGPGIWEDNDNQGTVLEYNDVENNDFVGILHEISWDATIANNYLRNNSSTSKSCPAQSYWCGEIEIANSGGVGGKFVDVYGNTLVPSSHGAGLIMLNESRGSGLYGPRLLQNVKVHNNTVDLSSGAVMGADNVNGTDPGMFTSQGNSFSYDSYSGAGSAAFRWKGSNGSFAWFQSQGQESHGTSR